MVDVLENTTPDRYQRRESFAFCLLFLRSSQPQTEEFEIRTLSNFFFKKFSPWISRLIGLRMPEHPCMRLLLGMAPTGAQLLRKLSQYSGGGGPSIMFS